MTLKNVRINHNNVVPVKILGHIVPVFENDYEQLKNLPKLNGVEISGEKTSEEYGIEGAEPLTNAEIEKLLNN